MSNDLTQEQLAAMAAKNEVVQGAALPDEPWGSLEGAVNGDALPNGALRGLAPAMPVVAAVDVTGPSDCEVRFDKGETVSLELKLSPEEDDAMRQELVKAADEQLAANAPKVDPLGVVEIRGYYTPGPVPVLSRDKPRLQVAFKLVLEADMHARLAFYEAINDQLKAALDDAIQEGGKMYALVKQDMAWKDRVVNMLERMHKVSKDFGGVDGFHVYAGSRESNALSELLEILAEDLPQEGA